jgi:hypothetical protein
MKSKLIVLAAFALASPAWADTTDAPDFDKTCDDVLNLQAAIQKAGQSADGRAVQKLSYCQAAEQSKKAASSNGMIWKVWAGVAGVCTTQCVLSMTGFGAGSQWICTGADIAGGVTDAAVTKNFAGAVPSLLGAFGGVMVNKMMNSGPQAAAAAKAGKSPKNWGACISAATATMSVFSKKSAANTATQTEDQNLASAAQLGPVTSALGPTTISAPTVGTNVVTNNSVTTINHYVSKGFSAPDSAGGGADCGGAASSGDSGRVMSCAMAADSTIPSWAASKPFADALKNLSGQTVGAFVASATDPNQAITAASGLPPDGASKLSGLLASTEKALGQNAIPATSPGETTYAGGHGGAPAGGGNDEAGMDPSAVTAAMAKMMKGLKGGKDDPVDPHNVKFSGVPPVPSWLRGPASSESDQTFSLFDRVTYRYYFVGRQIYFDEPATPGAKE